MILKPQIPNEIKFGTVINPWVKEVTKRKQTDRKFFSHFKSNSEARSWKEREGNYFFVVDA